MMSRDRETNFLKYIDIEINLKDKKMQKIEFSKVKK
jgi:hypothetical protein